MTKVAGADGEQGPAHFKPSHLDGACKSPRLRVQGSFQEVNCVYCALDGFMAVRTVVAGICAKAFRGV